MAGEGLETVQYFKKSLKYLEKNRMRQEERLASLKGSGVIHEITIAERTLSNTEHEISEIINRLSSSWKTD